MCLSTVTSTTRDRERGGIGWKVFKVRGKNLHGEFHGGLVEKGVWLKSKVEGANMTYPMGFHMFCTRREARSWAWSSQRVRKVQWRDFLAKGTQGNLHVIVAKEMMIL